MDVAAEDETAIDEMLAGMVESAESVLVVATEAVVAVLVTPCVVTLVD